MLDKNFITEYKIVYNKDRYIIRKNRKNTWNLSKNLSSGAGQYIDQNARLISKHMFSYNSDWMNEPYTFETAEDAYLILQDLIGSVLK